MSVMSKELEEAFALCIKRVNENRYEPDKVNCIITDLKSKVLREMATFNKESNED